MEDNKAVSLISIKFWQSLIYSYVTFVKKMTHKSIKYSKDYLFRYGFDVILFYGNLFLT